jgi:hypothetical protein
VNTQTKAAAYGAAGLALAGIVIFSGMALGVISTSSTEVVSILLTDPPSVPDGVSAVYLTYSGFALHASGLSGGWVATGGQGTVDTLGLVNLSQTISSANVPVLKYDLVKFNVSSALVEFHGINYSATINGGKLVVPIVGGLTVVSSHSAAAMVDIQLTVLNAGTSTAPEFVVATGARAVQLPSAEVTEAMGHPGYKYGLSNHSWFQSFAVSRSDALAISGVSLTQNSLSFTVNNPGPDAVVIRMVVLVPANGVQASSLFGSLANTSVFSVSQDGSGTLFGPSSASHGVPGDFHTALAGPGYQLDATRTFTFSFSGAITTTTSGSGVTSGSTYLLVLVGSSVLSIQEVVAT